MIESQIDNPMAKSLNMVKWHAKGVKLGDPRYVISHLQLGRIASSDWCNCRVLDRMMLYERRIENSMIKMMNELKRREIMRRIEYQDAEQQYEPSPSLRDEAATRRPAEKKGDLKKQTQFAPAEMGATSFLKGDYEIIRPAELKKTKPNKANLLLSNRPKEREKEKKRSRQRPVNRIKQNNTGKISCKWVQR